MSKIKQNSYVLFFYNDSKKWLVKISKNDKLHTHIGILKHSDAIGLEYGSRITTNKYKYVYLIEPTIYDFVMKIQHGTQIVYPKDFGYMAARAGIQSGQKIIEIGTGSGSLTTFLASIVKPEGHVYTFDVEPKFMEIAKKNITKAGMEKYITMKKLDIKTAKRMPLKDANVVIVDLGDPWTVVPQARKMLKSSGIFIAICPTMNQLEHLTSELVKNEFTDIECIEIIIRNIDAREGKTRHSYRGINHTAYLEFARKVYFKEKKIYSKKQERLFVKIR